MSGRGLIVSGKQCRLLIVVPTARCHPRPLASIVALSPLRGFLVIYFFTPLPLIIKWTPGLLRNHIMILNTSTHTTYYITYCSIKHMQLSTFCKLMENLNNSVGRIYQHSFLHPSLFSHCLVPSRGPGDNQSWVEAGDSILGPELDSGVTLECESSLQSSHICRLLIVHHSLHPADKS